MKRRDLLRVGAVLTMGVALGVRANPTARQVAITDGPVARTPPEPDRRRVPSPPSRPSRPSPGDDERLAAPPDNAPGDGTASDAAVQAADEPVPSVAVEVVCRDALGLVAAGSGARAHLPGRVTLHHTAVELGANRHAPGRLRAHQRFHQDQGWSDIAYHLGVDAAGNLYELRDPQVAGDTFTEYDPGGHYLIVCEGNYDIEQPSDAMLDAVARAIADGAQRYGFDPGSLSGHRDHAGTSCPGERLYRELDALRREARRYAEGVVVRTSTCGAEGRDRVAAIEDS